MKKPLLLTVLCFAGFTAICQNDTIGLDVLNAPTSPGFILLNQQPTDIERPTTPTDFAVSFRNSSNNFSAIPKNYAVEMAPLWLFKSKSISFKDAYGESSHTDPIKNIGQTFNLSLAYAPVDSAMAYGASQFGFGFKCSILRGKISEEFTKEIKKLNELHKRMGEEYHKATTAELEKDSDYVRLNRLIKTVATRTPITETDVAILQGLAKALEDRINVINNEYLRNTKNYEQEHKAVLKKLAKIGAKRTGVFMDFAGGAVLDFPTRVFDYSEINKFGAWLTLGNEGDHWSYIGLGRLLHNKKTPYLTDSNFVKTSDVSNLDLGFRTLYSKDKFSASVEAIYRNYLNSGNYTPGWKGTFYLGYHLGNNKTLSLNISRDFDGTVSKKGNLVTALNLIIGLGSERNISPN
jgi:hypothetical protein